MGKINLKLSKGGTRAYLAQARVAGKYVSKTFSSRRAAEDWIRVTEAAPLMAENIQTKEVFYSFQEWVQKYLNEAAPARSKELYRGMLKVWSLYLGERKPVQIKSRDIMEAWQALSRERKLAPGTANTYLGVLSSFFGVMEKKWFVIEKNPVVSVARNRAVPARCRYLSAEERGRLMKEVEGYPKLEVIVWIAMYTGMRKSEILNMRWENVDLNIGQVLLYGTKNGETRCVPLVGPALAALVRWGEQNEQKTGLVFPTIGKRNYIEYDWKKVRAKAGLADVHFHDLRHTAASYLAMSGATHLEIAEVLGHKSLQMVKRYSHLSESHTRSVLERMATKFGDVRQESNV